MKKIFITALLAVGMIFLGNSAIANTGSTPPSCSALPENSCTNVADTLKGSPCFCTFSHLLECVDLAKTLKGKGPYTVFAPTDAAFAKLPVGFIENLKCPQNKDKLIAFLRYHIVTDPITCCDLTKVTTIRTAEGRCISVSSDCNYIYLNGVPVKITNVKAANGNIHVIDSVLAVPR